MTNPDTHIYLYAKKWYKRGNVLDDLKKIISKRSLIEEQFINNTDILDVLLSIIFDEINKSGNPQLFFKNFITDSLPCNRWRVGCKQNVSQLEAMIKSGLSFLYTCSVKDLNLGEPDYSILPSSEITKEI